MCAMEKKRGQIIIEHGANPKPHEIRTAQSIAATGRTITLVAKCEIDGVRTADALIDGVPWEMKAPESGNMSAIQKNIRKAIKQSRCVIFDARRMKSVPGYAIEREVRKQASEFKSLKRLLFVNKLGEVIEIK